MRRFISPITGLVAALVISIGLCDTTARANFVVTTDTVNAAPGSTGFVQVRLATDSGSNTLSGFSFKVTLTGASVRFTGVDSSTTNPYVFGANGSGTLSFDTFPTTVVTVSDDYLAISPTFATLAPNTTYGLARFAFQVDGNAANGLRPITFTVGPVTQFVNANNIPYSSTQVSLVNGGINVQGANPVPVPAGLVLGFIGMGCFGVTRRFWNKKA